MDVSFISDSAWFASYKDFNDWQLSSHGELPTGCIEHIWDGKIQGLSAFIHNGIAGYLCCTIYVLMQKYLFQNSGTIQKYEFLNSNKVVFKKENLKIVFLAFLGYSIADFLTSKIR